MSLLLRPILELRPTVNFTSHFDTKLNQFPGPVFNQQPIDIRCETLPKVQLQKICHYTLEWVTFFPITSPEPVPESSNFKFQFRWPRNLPSLSPPPKIHLLAVYWGTTLGRCNRSYVELKLNSVALVRERTIPTERPPPVGEVSANFCG